MPLCTKKATNNNNAILQYLNGGMHNRYGYNTRSTWQLFTRFNNIMYTKYAYISSNVKTKTGCIRIDIYIYLQTIYSMARVEFIPNSKLRFVRVVYEVMGPGKNLELTATTCNDPSWTSIHCTPKLKGRIGRISSQDGRVWISVGDTGLEC